MIMATFIQLISSLITRKSSHKLQSLLIISGADHLFCKLLGTMNNWVGVEEEHDTILTLKISTAYADHLNEAPVGPAIRPYHVVNICESS